MTYLSPGTRRRLHAELIAYRRANRLRVVAAVVCAVVSVAPFAIFLALYVPA